jgi:hypothetical protein
MPGTILGTLIYMILFNFSIARHIILSTFYRWGNWHAEEGLSNEELLSYFKTKNHILRILPLEDKH